MKLMERVSRTVVKVLREKVIGTVVPSDNFPMDMLKWPGKMWTVSQLVAPMAKAQFENDFPIRPKSRFSIRHEARH